MKNITQPQNRILSLRALGIALGVASLLFILKPSARAGDNLTPPPPVIPPIGPVLQDVYAELLARWWQWTLAFPTNADPASDTAPQNAAQSGPVWFLAGLHGSVVSGGVGIVTRTITLPSDVALFFPVLSIEGDNTGCPTNTDYSAPELRAGLTSQWSAVSVTSCLIDGVPVSGLENPQVSPYLIDSSVFAYTLPGSNNIVACDFGEPCIPNGITVFPAVAKGVCLLLAPLPPGHHTIQFIGVVGPESAPFVYFNETYQVKVVPSFN